MSTTAEKLAWMDHGMCVAAGPERWQRYTAHDQEVICHGCPVREPCSKWLRYQPPPVEDPQPVQLVEIRHAFDLTDGWCHIHRDYCNMAGNR